MIYLDNAASVPMPIKVLDYYVGQCKKNFANASAKHILGSNAKKSIEESRTQILKSIQACHQYKLLFTASATESNNLAISSILEIAMKEILVNSFSQCIIYHQQGDHGSLVEPIKNFSSKYDKSVLLKEIPSHDDMSIDEDLWQQQVNNLEIKTFVIVITAHVHNVTGNISGLEIFYRIKETIEKKNRCYVHIDLSQSFSKIAIDVSSGELDSFTISSHKIGGPKGSACLVYLADVALVPVLFGGNHEQGLRSSTYNTEAINTMAFCALWRISQLETNYTYVEKLQQKTHQILSSNLKENYRKLFSQDLNSFLPYIFVFSVKNISSDIIMRHLEVQNIIIASSSACSSKNKKPQLMFEQMGVAKEFSKGVIRCSFSCENTLQQVEEFCRVISETYYELLDIA